MHTFTLPDVVALFVCAVIIAAVIHAAHVAQNAAPAEGPPEPPKRGDRIRLLVGIPHLGCPPGILGRITFIDRQDELVYFLAFDNGVTSVVFYEQEAWHFEVIR